MGTKQRDTAPGAKIHRITAAIAGQSASLNFPGPTRHLLIQANLGGGGARIFFSAADEAANVKFYELSAGARIDIAMAVSVVILQSVGVGSIAAISTHDGLRAEDQQAEDYVAA